MTIENVILDEGEYVMLIVKLDGNVIDTNVMFPSKVHHIAGNNSGAEVVEFASVKPGDKTKYSVAPNQLALVDKALVPKQMRYPGRYIKITNGEVLVREYYADPETGICSSVRYARARVKLDGVNQK